MEKSIKLLVIVNFRMDLLIIIRTGVRMTEKLLLYGLKEGLGVAFVIIMQQQI